MASTSRRNSTVTHMIVAMLVLFVPVVLITRLFTVDPAEAPVTAIDWQPVVETAAREADYTVVAPVNLPEGWIATRARFTAVGKPLLGGDPAPGDTVQLGFLSPEQRYIAVDQRDTAPEAFIDDVTRQGSPDGVSAVGEAEWMRYVSGDERTRSLVAQGDAVVIVSGDLPYEALEAFAATLEPVGA